MPYTTAQNDTDSEDSDALVIDEDYREEQVKKEKEEEEKKEEIVSKSGRNIRSKRCYTDDQTEENMMSPSIVPKKPRSASSEKHDDILLVCLGNNDHFTPVQLLDLWDDIHKREPMAHDIEFRLIKFGYLMYLDLDETLKILPRIYSIGTVTKRRGLEYLCGLELVTNLVEWLSIYVLDLLKNGEDKKGLELLDFITRTLEAYKHTSWRIVQCLSGLVADWWHRWMADFKEHQIEESDNIKMKTYTKVINKPLLKHMSTFARDAGDVKTVYLLAQKIFQDSVYERFEQLTEVLPITICDSHNTNSQYYNDRIMPHKYKIWAIYTTGQVHALYCLLKYLSEYFNKQENYEGVLSGVQREVSKYNPRLTKQSVQRQSLVVYNDAIATKFYEETKLFHAWQISNPLPFIEYMIKALQELQQGVLPSFAGDNTYIEMLNTCDEGVKQIYLPEFKKRLDGNKNASLLRFIFNVVKETPGLGQMKAFLEEHIHLMALKDIEECNEPMRRIEFVPMILKVHKKWNDFNQVASNDPEPFVKAWKRFITSNSVTTAANSSSTKLLAEYCDLLLKKIIKNPAEPELKGKLQQLMVAFNDIDNKVCQNIYTKMVAKLLLKNTPVSGDNSVVSKLFEVDHIEYTRILKEMLQDIRVSEHLNEDFQSLEVPLDIDFSIQVLSSHAWPLQQSPSFQLPTELNRAVNQFKAFYNTRYSSRKLIWVDCVSKAELITNCFMKRYTLQASTFQMAVLLQYNENTELSVLQLVENTGIDKESLIKVLQTLLEAKLLVFHQLEPEQLSELSIIALNNQYKNKKLRVNLNVPPKVEQDTNTKEDRSILIRAAIKGIMKKRKTLEHHKLVRKVLKEVSSRSEVTVIKKCIEVLIEEKYLERTKEGEKVTYSCLE